MYILQKAESRGFNDFGWLKTKHTFSFNTYNNPERMNFGKLRVLNDDVVEAAAGFSCHPHQNMEIISVPLSGALEHMDSKGHKSVIEAGDIQVMSAGTGIYHSEYNSSSNDQVDFLQIWILPKEENITPQYDQKSFPPLERKNSFQLLVSPIKQDNTLWINQDAFISIALFEEQKRLTYDLQKNDNGVYLFLIKGQMTVNGVELSPRDGLGFRDENHIDMIAKEESEILCIEVPLS